MRVSLFVRPRFLAHGNGGGGGGGGGGGSSGGGGDDDDDVDSDRLF